MSEPKLTDELIQYVEDATRHLDDRTYIDVLEDVAAALQTSAEAKQDELDEDL